MRQQRDGDAVVRPLIAVLADTYALAVKTHGAHWNVKGPGFFRLHSAFDEQYQALLLAADILAERVRALNHSAPASMRQLLELSSIGEPPGSDDMELVKALRDDHQLVCAACHQVLEIAEKEKDQATADLLVGRIEEHDKTVWMLTATLGD